MPIRRKISCESPLRGLSGRRRAYFQVATHPDVAGQALRRGGIDAREEHALEGGRRRQVLGAAPWFETASAANPLAAAPKNAPVVYFTQDIGQAGARRHLDGFAAISEGYARHGPTLPEQRVACNLALLNIAASLRWFDFSG